MTANLRRAHLGVEFLRFVAQSVLLPVTGGRDLLSHLFAGCSDGFAFEVAKRNRRNFQVNVDAIQQRPADATFSRISPMPDST